MTDTTPIDRESVDPLHVKHPVDGIIRRLDEHYDVQSDVEQDPCGAWFAIQDLCAALDAAEAKLAKAVEGFEQLARLGNGDRYGNSLGNLIAQEYLAELTGGKDD